MKDVKLSNWVNLKSTIKNLTFFVVLKRCECDTCIEIRKLRQRPDYLELKDKNC